ncbi:unnamed protein product [Cunninghamella blakesleeana]
MKLMVNQLDALDSFPYLAININDTFKYESYLLQYLIVIKHLYFRLSLTFMDPGVQYIKKIKTTLPNLVHKDVTVQHPNSSIDLPWSDFSKFLSSKYSNINSVTPQDLFVGSFENCHLGTWDGTTYQDNQR